MKIFLLIAIIGDASNCTRFLKKQRFFNSATVLLNFFINQASNVAQVFLSTFNPYHTERHFIFGIFVSMLTIMDIIFETDSLVFM